MYTPTDTSKSILILCPKHSAAPCFNPTPMSIDRDHQLAEPAMWRKVVLRRGCHRQFIYSVSYIRKQGTYGKGNGDTVMSSGGTIPKNHESIIEALMELRIDNPDIDVL